VCEREDFFAREGVRSVVVALHLCVHVVCCVCVLHLYVVHV